MKIDDLAGIQRHASLAPYTTFKVGGPADWLFHARSAEDVRAAVAAALTEGLPVTVLGGGSNVLVADAGVRGLVVRIHGGDVRAVSPTIVRADGGLTINGLVRWTINRGIAGVESWAGTPGTVGGGIFGNAHFGRQLLGDIVIDVKLASRAGETYEIPRAEMGFGYDRSRLQTTHEVLLSATFRVGTGEPTALRARARESLAFRKRTQPLDTHSAGCVFQNPDPAKDRVPDGIPCAAGALVDRAGLKGATIGGARVSPAHGNFIVNDGSATARQIRELIERCRRAVEDRFGVQLRDEIVYLGEFDVDTAD
jgi:UDP-N-acetylmuramate dehydrogenase